MSWLFGKKKEKGVPPSLPELPELPPLPDLGEQERFNFSGKPTIKNELPALPSFLSSATGERVSNEMVKQTIRETEEEPFTRELEEETTIGYPPEPLIIKPPVREFQEPIVEEPVFIRIDKYKDSVSNFQEIKKKLLEIEHILKDIKETRAKEEAELEEWVREIEEAKEKLSKIDKTIFQKLEA